MKKLKLIKEDEIAIKSEMSIYCDFCGGENSRVFTSTFDDRKMTIVESVKCKSAQTA